jgi:arabinan endo-1,5-alpha-L-arabinosidase
MSYGSNVTLTSDRFNNPNSALDFQSGYNTLPGGVYFNGDFTFTVWIYYNQNPAWATILEFSNSRADVVSFQSSLASTGSPGMVIGFSDFSETFFEESLETGRWYHVAFVLCGRTGKIYVDGQLKASSQLDRPANLNRDTNFVGGNSFGDANLNAKLDELRIYNRCMSQNEINNLMNFVNV